MSIISVYVYLEHHEHNTNIIHCTWSIVGRLVSIMSLGIVVRLVSLQSSALASYVVISVSASNKRTFNRGFSLTMALSFNIYAIPISKLHYLYIFKVTVCKICIYL